MKLSTLSMQTLLAASLTLAFCGVVHAEDKPAAAAADATKAEKSDKPAEKELPSKPYPKNPAPAKLTPSLEKPVGSVNAAAVVTPKPEAAKPKEEKVAEAIFDKPVPAKKRKPAAPAKSTHAHAAIEPSMKQLVSDTVAADAHGQSADREPYKVQTKDTLDSVIRKTLPTTPFSNGVLREAFMKANPQVFPEGRLQRLRTGQMLRIPDAAMLRLVVLGEVTGKADSSTDDSRGSAQDAPKAVPAAAPPTAAPAIDIAPPLSVPRQPVAVASANMPAPAVSPEEKKKWIRFP